MRAEWAATQHLASRAGVTVLEWVQMAGQYNKGNLNLLNKAVYRRNYYVERVFSSLEFRLAEIRPEIDVSGQGIFLGPSGFQYEPQNAAYGAEFTLFPRSYGNSARTECLVSSRPH